MPETTKITADQVVTMHYRLTGPDGDLLDTSEGDEPLVYLHGHGNIIPGLEAELEGRQAGDHLSVDVAAKDGYGEHDPERLIQVPKAQLGFEPTVGAIVRAEAPDGTSVMLKIAAVEGEEVTLDGNHPLAGQALHFEVDVVSVREATPEEQAHGHVHGPDGHHHH